MPKLLSIIIPQLLLDEEIWHIAKKNIQTIKEYTDVPYEIVMIDNGSKCRRDWIGRNCHILIQNYKNMGNGCAWSQGLKRAKGDYLCLMDNDVFVTKNWIKPLLKELEDKKIGVIFPLSKCDEDENFKFRLVGFCWIMRKEVYEEVGDIDYINFPLGNFEDDDYFRRVQDKGYLLKCTRKSKIYHKGRATCDKIPEIRKIWFQNRQNYVRKHNNKFPKFITD